MKNGTMGCVADGGTSAEAVHVMARSFAAIAPAALPPPADDIVFGRLVGASAPMLEVRDRLRRVGGTDAPVLLVGESGTGKELAARVLHELSRRSRGPFLAVNVGAIPAAMVESELFGHERGSFTGAVQRHLGVFERARGGTLVLDEITEMPIELQVKLLRVLDGAPTPRVGGETDLDLDVRVIAATNVPPEASIASGNLRADLYFRVGVVRIELPPLRDRGSDVELLARHFVGRLNAEFGTDKRLAPGALDCMAGYVWPGNVRELRNLVSSAFIMADDEVSLERCGLLGQPAAAPGPPAREHADAAASDGPHLVLPIGISAAEAERRLLLATLDRCGGNKNDAARILGLSLKTIYNRLKRYRSTLGATEGSKGPGGHGVEAHDRNQPPA